MHIPDGYLSPSTCAVTGGLALPITALAARRLKARLGTREAPMLAAGAAFAFCLMMLNVPVPGGTTAHAVGGTLVAVVLGPEAAVLAMSVTLTIQALFFADGGLLSLGANLLNMGVILPLSGFTIYRALSSLSRRGVSRPWAAAAGAYAGLNLAALAAAIELGVQPALFHSPSGAPLYCPYHLSQTVPAMLLAHLTAAGGVEAAVTGLSVGFLLRTQPEALSDSCHASGALANWAWRAVALLLVLSPLGLLAPGTAFGEASLNELRRTLGFVPQGMAHLGRVWTHAVFPDYGFPGRSSSPFPMEAVGYWVSALCTVALLLVLFVARLWFIRLRSRRSSPTQVRSANALTTAAPAAGSVPGWLLMNSASAPLTLSGKRRRASFLEKTIRDANSLARDTIFAETIARSPGLVQRLEARARLISLGSLLLGACLVRRLPTLLVLLGLAVVLGTRSRVPTAVLLRRITPVALFAAVLALPGALGIVNPGPTLVRLLSVAWLHLDPSIAHRLVITVPGMEAVARLTLRAASAAAFTLLLTLTTRWSDLLKSLRTLLIPESFVMILGMVYRFLFLFLQTVEDAYTARRSRTLRRDRLPEARRFIASSLVTLFSRSQALAEEVHGAMLSRGYRGEARIHLAPIPTRDRGIAAGFVLLALVLVLGDRLLG